MASAKCQPCISKLSPGTALSVEASCCCVLTGLPPVTFTMAVSLQASNPTGNSGYCVWRCKPASNRDLRAVRKSELAAKKRSHFYFHCTSTLTEETPEPDPDPDPELERLMSWDSFALDG